MPRKEQGWITFQTSEEERQLLEQVCQRSQRSKTEILRELVRGLGQESATESSPSPASRKAEKATKAGFEESSKIKKPLKVSSRNVLKGKIVRVINGSVNSEITLEIVHKVTLISIITKASVEELGLVEGSEAYAVIKSNDVVIAME